MKVIFTCGGTAGHVNPALALAGLIRERKPDSEILFVGARRGIEKDLIEAAGWPFRAVEVSSFHRSMRPREIRHNLISLKHFLCSPREARRLLREFPADLVVGTGGYASYPVVQAASKMGIPTAIHESNAIPGLTTRLLEDHAALIMVGFEECRKNYKHPEKVLVTGTPVRGDFFLLTKREAKQKAGMDGGRPLIVSFFGSLGASEMNREMAQFLALESRDGAPFYHVHGAGAIDCRHMNEHLTNAGADLSGTPELEVREYIRDMNVLMRAASASSPPLASRRSSFHPPTWPTTTRRPTPGFWPTPAGPSWSWKRTAPAKSSTGWRGISWPTPRAGRPWAKKWPRWGTWTQRSASMPPSCPCAARGQSSSFHSTAYHGLAKKNPYAEGYL